MKYKNLITILRTDKMFKFILIWLSVATIADVGLSMLNVKFNADTISIQAMIWALFWSTNSNE